MVSFDQKVLTHQFQRVMFAPHFHWFLIGTSYFLCTAKKIQGLGCLSVVTCKKQNIITYTFHEKNFLKYKNPKFSFKIITHCCHTLLKIWKYKNIKAYIISTDLHSLCVNLPWQNLINLELLKTCTVKKSWKSLNANIFFCFHFKNKSKSGTPLLLLYILNVSLNKICQKKWFQNLLG
jgi:hypothetical protein